MTATGTHSNSTLDVLLFVVVPYVSLAIFVGGFAIWITAAGVSIGIFVNNIQVTFLAYAGGMTLGLLTGYVLATNGILLGAVAGLATGAAVVLFDGAVVPDADHDGLR